MFKAQQERLAAKSRAEGVPEEVIQEALRRAKLEVMPYIIFPLVGAAGIVVGTLVSLLI